eukprot:169513-Chlamydomonas_euryale.AAC.1
MAKVRHVMTKGVANAWHMMARDGTAWHATGLHRPCVQFACLRGRAPWLHAQQRPLRDDARATTQHMGASGVWRLGACWVRAWQVGAWR